MRIERNYKNIKLSATIQSKTIFLVPTIFNLKMTKVWRLNTTNTTRFSSNVDFVTIQAKQELVW